jgi:hypothetical protein
MTTQTHQRIVCHPGGSRDPPQVAKHRAIRLALR